MHTLRSRCRICFKCMCSSAPPSCCSQAITVGSAKGTRLACRSLMASSTLPFEANSITMLRLPSACGQQQCVFKGPPPPLPPCPPEFRPRSSARPCPPRSNLSVPLMAHLEGAVVRGDVRMGERRKNADLVLHLGKASDGSVSKPGFGSEAEALAQGQAQGQALTCGAVVSFLYCTLESSARGISCTRTCLLTTKWPVRRWRRSTAVPKLPLPSVLTFSYLP